MKLDRICTQVVDSKVEINTAVEKLNSSMIQNGETSHEYSAARANPSPTLNAESVTAMSLWQTVGW